MFARNLPNIEYETSKSGILIFLHIPIMNALASTWRILVFLHLWWAVKVNQMTLERKAIKPRIRWSSSALDACSSGLNWKNNLEVFWILEFFTHRKTYISTHLRDTAKQWLRDTFHLLYNMNNSMMRSLSMQLKYLLKREKTELQSSENDSLFWSKYSK